MATAFSAALIRLNQAVFAHLPGDEVITIGGVSVTGIFDAAYAQGSASGMAMASSMPTLTLPTASVPANPVGVASVVSGVNYTVAEHQPDGAGVSVLYLERVL